jgi:hypothetical protein
MVMDKNKTFTYRLFVIQRTTRIEEINKTILNYPRHKTFVIANHSRFDSLINGTIAIAFEGQKLYSISKLLVSPYVFYVIYGEL